MEKFILAKKVGMTQLFDPDGRVRAVTVLEAGPNVITGVRTEERDGYGAIQLGAEKVQKKKLTKPEAGHSPYRHLREVRVGDPSAFTVGDRVTAEAFKAGDRVMVSAVSIGKGFQGVVKRHGFGGAPASHGHGGALRAPGSIGGAFPQRVLKGKKMAGRMGGARVSVKNLRVSRVDAEKNLLFVEGAVPGKRGSLVEVKTL